MFWCYESFYWDDSPLSVLIEITIAYTMYNYILYTYTLTAKTVGCQYCRGHRGRMVVGFIKTCAICIYSHLSCEFKPHSWQGVLDTTLCDKVCQWFSPGTQISPTNKTDRHDITEILLKVASNTITITP